MAMFGASGRESYDALYDVLLRPADTSALEREQTPGALEGDLGGVAVAGLKSAGTRIGMAATSLPRSGTAEIFGIEQEIEAGAYGEAAQRYFEEDEAAREARAQSMAQSLVDLRPDPKTNGLASQVLFGVGDVLGLVTAAAVTRQPALVAGSIYGYTRYEEGLVEGLDPATAATKGIIEGSALGVGVALPAALTGSLAFRAASGAALNLGIDIPERGAVSTLLRARGYPEMAQQYAPFDTTAMVTSAILGAAFGAAFGPRARVKIPEPDAIPPSAVDAALVANEIRHAELDVAPGIPTDTRTRQAHTAALNSAIESLVMGRQVNVEGLLQEAGFTGARPDFDALRVIADELDKAGAPDLVAQVRALEEQARARGLIVDPDSLGSLVLSDRPVETQMTRVAEREATPIRIGEDVVPARMMLVEAADVQATMRKASNQYRDRTRVASEQQIADMAARLDPGLLGDAPVMDYGAPVLAADGRVIGGNGRVAAIGRAYEIGNAEGYRASLRAQFGETVDTMQQPMAVRVLQRDVDVARAAMLSNEGGGLRMSALEQAKVDAERLGDFRAFEFGEDGALDLASNMGFIRQWAAEMPQNQRAAIMDADGRLSAEGAARLRNAILYRAYGDSPTLARLVEATDPGSRNIAAAMTRAAPAVADAKEAIGRGDLFPLGIHDDIVAAVEKVEALRASGTAVGDWLRQMDAFGDGMTPEARLLVTFMDRNIRSARAIADGVYGFYNRLLEAGNPKQASLLEAAQPDKMRMLELALDAPMYRRGKTTGETVDTLASAARAIFGRDADRLMDAGRLRIVQSVRDLPGSGHPADVGGMFWRGESWVVADNTGLAQIRGRILHEIGEHAGMREMLGADLYRQVLDTVAAKAEADPLFAEARALAEARSNLPEHVPAETLAYLVENAPELPVVRRILAAVRQWVYRATGGRLVDLTQADLQAMAVASLRRYARAAEVAARGDAPWYMTLFHGTPNPFKPEEGAPLGRLRWKYINTGEGAQAFGYGHYLAQQEWIARTRYRDRLVRIKGRSSMTIDLPDGGKFEFDASEGPAYRVGDRIVHPSMKGEDGGVAWAIRELKNTTPDEVRGWAKEDAKEARRVINEYERGFYAVKDGDAWVVMQANGKPMEYGVSEEYAMSAVEHLNGGYRKSMEPRYRLAQEDLVRAEAALRAIDEVTVPVSPSTKTTPDGLTEVFLGDLSLGTYRDLPPDLAISMAKNDSRWRDRILRPDITEIRPEPKGALYGKVIPDEDWNRMMIWDAPLKEQPENVQRALEKLAGFEVKGDSAEFNASDAYRFFVDLLEEEDGSGALSDDLMWANFEVRRRRAPEGTDPAEFDADVNFEEMASVLLWREGVPGHRFLDGETRARGWDDPDAKFNVVLYSDDLGRVAWEAKGPAGQKPNEWTTANGKARIRLEDDGMNGRFVVEVEGKEIDYELSLEAATKIAEDALGGELYSRTGDGDTMTPPDPADETTMPYARAFSARADAEIATAKELSQGFLPAIECALRLGA